jgi:hypothetical protein
VCVCVCRSCRCVCVRQRTASAPRTARLLLPCRAAAQGRGAAEGAEEGGEAAGRAPHQQAEEERAPFDPYAPLDPNAVGELLVKPMQVRVCVRTVAT